MTHKRMGRPRIRPHPLVDVLVDGHEELLQNFTQGLARGVVLVGVRNQSLALREL